MSFPSTGRHVVCSPILFFIFFFPLLFTRVFKDSSSWTRDSGWCRGRAAAWIRGWARRSFQKRLQGKKRATGLKKKEKRKKSMIDKRRGLEGEIDTQKKTVERMKSLTWRIWSFKERWEIYKQLLKIITFFLLKEQVKRSCFPLTTTESVPERNGSRCRWEGGIFFLGLPALSALPYSPYSDGRQPCLYQRQRGNGVYRHWKHTHTHIPTTPSERNPSKWAPSGVIRASVNQRGRGGRHGRLWELLKAAGSSLIWGNLTCSFQFSVCSEFPSDLRPAWSWWRWRSKKKNTLWPGRCVSRLEGEATRTRAQRTHSNPTLFQLITVKSLRHMDSVNENVMLWNARRAKVYHSEEEEEQNAHWFLIWTIIS